MGWKTRGRLAGFFLLSLSFITVNSGYSAGPARADVGGAAFSFEIVGERKIAARSEAQRYLESLYAFVLDDQRAIPVDAGVKIAVPAAGGGHDLIWVHPLARNKGSFVGRLVEMPQSSEKWNMGDLIAFEPAQVRDWYFLGPSGRMFGAFETRAALDGLPGDTAAIISAMLSERPAPAHW